MEEEREREGGRGGRCMSSLCLREEERAGGGEEMPPSPAWVREEGGEVCLSLLPAWDTEAQREAGGGDGLATAPEGEGAGRPGSPCLRRRRGGKEEECVFPILPGSGIQGGAGEMPFLWWL